MYPVHENYCEFAAVAEVVQCLQQPMALADASGKVLCVNQAAAALLGDEAETFIGELWPSWLESGYQGLYRELQSSADGQYHALQHGAREVQLRRVDGALLWVKLSLSFVQGLLPLFLVGFEDLSSQKAEVQRLTALAATDYLTGLANRRTLMEALEKQWRQCLARRHPISVVIVDVDFFKQFNDLYGHLKGDECLRQIAAALASTLPSPQCLAARFGGEEFVLLLPGFNAAMAELIAKQVSEAVAAIDIAAMGLPQGALLTVSQGIACEISGQFRTADAMLLGADTALYRAKREGRNKIILSD